MGDGQTTSWPNGSGRATLKCGFGYSYLAIWGGFYFFGFKFFLMFLMSIFFKKKIILISHIGQVSSFEWR
jgi:hypothetical protein